MTGAERVEVRRGNLGDSSRIAIIQPAGVEQMAGVVVRVVLVAAIVQNLPEAHVSGVYCEDLGVVSQELPRHMSLLFDPRALTDVRLFVTVRVHNKGCTSSAAYRGRTWF